MKTTLLATTLLLFTGAGSVLAEGGHEGGHDEMEVGQPAESKSGFTRFVSRLTGQDDIRTVQVKLMETEEGEMVFEPRTLEFQAGETVRLAISNVGQVDHEFVMDTVAAVAEHKELMEKFPEMEHDDPNAVRLAPGEKDEILWTFTNAGDFQFACLIPGHYEAGMHGELNVN